MRSASISLSSREGSEMPKLEVEFKDRYAVLELWDGRGRLWSNKAKKPFAEALQRAWKELEREVRNGRQVQGV